MVLNLQEESQQLSGLQRERKRHKKKTRQQCQSDQKKN